MSGFAAAPAARLGGCSRSQLGHWRRNGVVVPSEPDGAYSFRDLVALRVVVSLLDAGLPMVRVRAALAVLRREVADASDELAGLRIVTDGVSVFACYDDGQILDALRSGQLALFVPVDRFARALRSDVAAFAAERDEFLAHLRGTAEHDRLDAHDDEGIVGHSVVDLGIAR
jgi:DNA-binding transcriptional MerR regulator